MQTQSNQIMSEFILDSNFPVCEFCGDTENTHFYFKNYKIFCSQCADDDSQIDAIKIINPPFCVVSGLCEKKAKWMCSHKDIYFCDECHIINCLLKEKSNFVCQPRPLYLNLSEELCTVCNKINAEFKKPDGKRICSRCATTMLNSASLINELQLKMDNVILIYQELYDEVIEISHANQLQLAKFSCYLNELECLLNFKFAIRYNQNFNACIQKAKEQKMLNTEKQEKIELIGSFLQKEFLILNLINNSMIDLKQLEVFFKSVKQQIDELKCVFIIQVWDSDLAAEQDLVCSQNSESAYENHALMLSNERTVDDISEEENLTLNQNIEELSTNDLYPPGDLIELPDQEAEAAELVYYRDPFWMIICTSEKSALRRQMLGKIQKIINPQPLNSDSLHLGLKILIKDLTKRKADGKLFKRGLIERMPSNPGGTYCVNVLDFGYKLQLKDSAFYKLPDELADEPSYVFCARMMGLQPVSGFTFTKIQRINAYSILKKLDATCKSEIVFKRL